MTTVTLTPVEPAGRPLTLKLTGTATAAGGVGGWARLDRPRRTEATSWESTPAKTLTVPCLLDGFEPGAPASVEADVARLEQLGRPTAPGRPPPVLRVSGPVPTGPDDRWVIDTLTWGQHVRRLDQARIQQWVDVALLEHNRADLVSILRSPAAIVRDTRSGTPASTAVHTVVAGDTLSGIAAARLGDWSRWTEIRDLNGLESTLIRPGQKLRLPT